MASQPVPAVNGQASPKYACQSCRLRKIKCNGTRPVCSTCNAHERQCEYDRNGPRRRSRVPGSRRAQRERRLNNGAPGPTAAEHHQSPQSDLSSRPATLPGNSPGRQSTHLNGQDASSNHSFNASLSGSCQTQARAPSQVDVNEHLAVDPSGNVEVRGPTNTLYEPLDRHEADNPGVPEQYATAMLTANAALEQQKEAGYKETLLRRGFVEDVPAELALHLLDIHWSRHHFFLITYRTAFYRDLMTGGPYYSPLLLYAILAVSSRYSERPEVGGGDHSVHSGKHFYDKARQLLAEDMEKSTIPTATALLLMGNALVSAGQVDRGWLYTGMGIRMIINLGLHVDADSYTAGLSRKKTLEETEIRRRLFWGAFVCEKLQSLYLGRPFLIHEGDTHVPKKFLDVYEEGQVWRPVPDHAESGSLSIMATNSVTSFTSMCKLAETCGDIMASFYAVRAKGEPREVLHAARTRIRGRLADWAHELPESIRFTPWEAQGREKTVPIHVIVLHTVYHSLLILLERPFVANGHLSSPEENIGSWAECTIASEKIAHLLHAYRRTYSFRRIPYQLCYTTYVASTILVRNANNDRGASPSVKHLAVCLKAFEEMKLAHPGSSRMLTIIRSLMGRLGVNVDDEFLDSISTSTPRPATLPTTDFEASNSAAIYNRNINIDTIRQSFAPSRAPSPSRETHATAYLEETHDPALRFGLGPDASLEPDFNYGAMEMPYRDFGTQGWNFSATGLDEDLLFGVLGME